MNIEDVRERKEILEGDIKNLIEEFNNETDVQVIDIKLDLINTSLFGGKHARYTLNRVAIDILV